MKHSEFRATVDELRRRQKRFFNCRKDSPDKPKAKELMQQQERIVFGEVDRVMAVRPKNKQAESEAEEFFLLVAKMVDEQRKWMKLGGGWMSGSDARTAEKAVDEWLRETKLREETERRLAAERMQTSLF